MVVSHNLKMHLDRKELLQGVEVPQGDANTRRIRMLLYAGQCPWQIPEQAAVLIRYQKQDGTQGEYDTLPDGSVAWSVSGNELLLDLTPQVLSAPGSVMLWASLYLGEKVLSTFAVEIRVQAAGEGTSRSSGEPKHYFHVTRVLSGPDSARVGQILRVAAVDGSGRVTGTEAVDPPRLADDQIRIAVEDYMAENPVVGAQGPRGEKGEDGEDYVLTAADKAEIAEMVEGATVVQAPRYVESVEEMTDTDRVYVLKSTGHIFAYMNTATEQEVTVTDNIVGTTDNPYATGRLGSSGSVSADVNTHTVTPYINVAKEEYRGKTIRIHLEGNRYASEADETYIMAGTYDANKAAIAGRAYTSEAAGGILDDFDNAGMTIEVLGETSAVMTLPVPLANDGGKTVSFMRFCGLGTHTDTVYITYLGTRTVIGGQWVDTGTTYAPALTDADKQQIAEEAARILDAQLLELLGDGTVTV